LRKDDKILDSLIDDIDGFIIDRKAKIKSGEEPSVNIASTNVNLLTLGSVFAYLAFVLDNPDMHEDTHEMRNAIINMQKQFTDMPANNVIEKIDRFKNLYESFVCRANDIANIIDNHQIKDNANSLVQGVKGCADKINADCVFILAVLSSVNLSDIDVVKVKDILYIEGKIAKMCQWRAIDIERITADYAKFRQEVYGWGGDERLAKMADNDAANNNSIGKPMATIEECVGLVLGAIDTFLDVKAIKPGFDKLNDVINNMINNGHLAPFSYEDVIPPFTKQQESAMVRQFLMENAIANKKDMTIQEIDENAKFIVRCLWQEQ
jgi:hypothetical protein